MASFKEWLIFVESATRPGSKQNLYPAGYGGIGLYPANDMMNWGADSFTYMSQKQKVFKYIWGDGFLANPNPGERNKEAWPEGRPDLTGTFKMIDDRGILSKLK